MRILVGVFGEGALNDSIENVDFNAFGRYNVEILGNKAVVIIQYYLLPPKVAAWCSG